MTIKELNRFTHTEEFMMLPLEERMRIIKEIKNGDKSRKLPERRS